MKKYKCSYENSEMQVILAEKVLASSPREAYEKFIEKVGVQDETVYVETGFFSSETFNDHVASVMDKQRELAEKKKKIEGEKEAVDTKNNFSQNQESGWATFLNICGVLNLILFVIGGIWLLNARSSEQFAAMNLTIIGLVAAINCFFFSFLVNTFTKIQNNTHQTTILLSKLIDKTESKD